MNVILLFITMVAFCYIGLFLGLNLSGYKKIGINSVGFMFVIVSILWIVAYFIAK